jgi:hypothetical protein
VNCQDCRACPAELVGAVQQGLPSGPWLPSLVRVAGFASSKMKAPNVVPEGLSVRGAGHLGVGIAARGPAAMHELVRCSSVSKGCNPGDSAPRRGFGSPLSITAVSKRVIEPSVYRRRSRSLCFRVCRLPHSTRAVPNRRRPS